MKIAWIVQACLNHDYILLRDEWGNLYGFNCKFALLITMNDHFKWSDLTKNSMFHGWRPCSFHEYLTHKIHFVK